MAMSAPDYQSYMGPGDRNLPNSEIMGYQPVSRIGEVVMNSFVDAHEFSTLNHDQLTLKQLCGAGGDDADKQIVEYRPQYHEWATVQPGMICVSRKQKTQSFRHYAAAETAVPVIVCCACLPLEDEINYFFSGVARSKSVRTPDDGIGPNVDEFFTVSLGGLVTLLNTSGGHISNGDLVEWCFAGDGVAKTRRAKQQPRRIGIQIASVSSPKIIGTAKSFAKAGETFDLLLRQ